MPLSPDIIALCGSFSLKECFTINSRIVFQAISICYKSFTADTRHVSLEGINTSFRPRPGIMLYSNDPEVAHLLKHEVTAIQ